MFSVRNVVDSSLLTEVKKSITKRKRLKHRNHNKVVASNEQGYNKNNNSQLTKSSGNDIYPQIITNGGDDEKNDDLLVLSNDSKTMLGAKIPSVRRFSTEWRNFQHKAILEAQNGDLSPGRGSGKYSDVEGTVGQLAVTPPVAGQCPAQPITTAVKPPAINSVGLNLIISHDKQYQMKKITAVKKTKLPTRRRSFLRSEAPFLGYLNSQDTNRNMTAAAIRKAQHMLVRQHSALSNGRIYDKDDDYYDSEEEDEDEEGGKSYSNSNSSSQKCVDDILHISSYDSRYSMSPSMSPALASASPTT